MPILLKCALGFLLSGTVFAAESESDKDVIEISLGETIYFQLTSSMPTGRSVAAIRVSNPNRNYLVVKATLEPGELGAKHQLVVKNGYDQLLFFATDCPHSSLILKGAKPGVETKIDIPSSTTRIALCNFGLTSTR